LTERHAIFSFGDVLGDLGIPLGAHACGTLDLPVREPVVPVERPDLLDVRHEAREVREVTPVAVDLLDRRVDFLVLGNLAHL